MNEPLINWMMSIVIFTFGWWLGIRAYKDDLRNGRKQPPKYRYQKFIDEYHKKFNTPDKSE